MTGPRCTRCFSEPAYVRGLGKKCLDADAKLAKKAARQKLALKTVADVKRVAQIPSAERAQLEAEAAYVPAEKATAIKNQFTQAVEAMHRWRHEPWNFVREVLGATPDVWQDEVLHAVVGLQADGSPLPDDQPHDKIALKACKGPGKTAVLAWIAIWFMVCFENPKVVATSVTEDNLRTNLWTEMALWIDKSEVTKKALKWGIQRIELRERPETCFMAARTWPKEADKTQQAQTLAGIHAQNTLLLLDESGDIPEAVMVTGLAHHSTFDPSGKSPETHLTLQAGNPTRLDSALGIACTRDRKRWWVKEITGDPDAKDRAPRMDIEWCREQIETYGREHPFVLINVMGKFPPTSDNKLLGPEEIRAAMQLVIDPRLYRDAPRVCGVDVGRSVNRDPSVLCRRQGHVVYPFKMWRINDSMILVGQLVYWLDKFKPVMTFVDATGVGGPVYDRLKELGYPVYPVYFGNPARQEKRFKDKRTEIWWDMADAIAGRPKGVTPLALPTDNMLVGELSAPTYQFVSKGAIKLESKEDMEKRGVASPNHADALACTFAAPVAQLATGQDLPAHARQGRGQIKTEYNPYEEGA